MKKKMLIPVCVAAGCLAAAIFTGIKTNGAGVVSASVVDAFNIAQGNEISVGTQVIDVESAASVSALLAGVQGEETQDLEEPESEEAEEVAEETEEEAEVVYNSDIVDAEAVAPVYEVVSPVWNETAQVTVTAQPKETKAAPVAVKKAEVKKTEVKNNNKPEAKESIKASGEVVKVPEAVEETVKVPEATEEDPAVEEDVEFEVEDEFEVDDEIEFDGEFDVEDEFEVEDEMEWATVTYSTFNFIFEKETVSFSVYSMDFEMNPENNVKVYYINDEEVSAEEYEKMRDGILDDTSRGELLEQNAISGCHLEPVEY